jgi:pyruvate/2-oxoglutarate dehydrogenase complex dihydrolipoamide acyltransferase (E2) component
MHGLVLPKMIEHMTAATIEAVHVAPGRSLRAGEKLMDVSVDLGGAFLQNCPPISYYRLVLREAATLERVCVAPGDQCEPGAVLALFGSNADEPDDGTMGRPVRVATAGILPGSWMWSQTAGP